LERRWTEEKADQRNEQIQKVKKKEETKWLHLKMHKMNFYFS
jgi:hypothetical protein